MLLDANRILSALTRELGRLQAQVGDHDVDGSGSQAIPARGTRRAYGFDPPRAVDPASAAVYRALHPQLV
jgi:hypothetical protein